MKTLALLIILVLHTSGLWSHLPSHTRGRLVTAGTSSAVAVATQSFQTTAVGPLPIQVGTAPLQLDAAGAYAIDTTTGTVLYAKDASTPRPIASVTKIATLLVILSRHVPTDIIKVPRLPTYQPGDELIGLVAGESYTVADLARAALIYSANDAADALALADSGTIPKFADQLNAKMAQWEITGAHFSNPTGLQDTGNSASPAALAKIAALAIKNPFIRQTVAQDHATITSAAGRVLQLQTTDDLLASGQFYGIKTGYTPAAGECFVGLTRINGHEVVTVVLNAGDRFGTTQALTNWIGQNWQWL